MGRLKDQDKKFPSFFSSSFYISFLEAGSAPYVIAHSSFPCFNETPLSGFVQLPKSIQQFQELYFFSPNMYLLGKTVVKS